MCVCCIGYGYGMQSSLSVNVSVFMLYSAAVYSALYCTVLLAVRVWWVGGWLLCRNPSMRNSTFSFHADLCAVGTTSVD